MELKNKLVVFCGPSGAGKSTVAKHVMRSIPVFELSISATTRGPRKGEEHGKDYYFVSVEDFEAKLSKDAFLEHEQVYDGLYYGTLFSEMDRIWANDHVPFLDLDVKGAANLKEKYGSNGLFVFIHPGTIDILAERLRKRGTEDARSIEKRMRRASFELEYANKFDYVLKNDNLERANKEIVAVVKTFLEK